MSAPLRAVLVEDSGVQARALARMLEADGDISVVAIAADTAEAIAAASRHRPDVVTMDLDIPGAGGQHAIERIMAEAPVPILVVSGLIDGRRATRAVEALAAGAVDALPKPAVWSHSDELELRRHVRRVARIPVIRRRPQPPPRPPARSVRGPRRRAGAVVAIAASTGGPAALATVLSGLAGERAPILVVQHIHPSFAGGFAAWLSSAAGVKAVMAEDGMELCPDCVHVAPGDAHLRLGPGSRLDVSPHPPALHRPSANELFRSVAVHAGADAVGVILTGMGEDGAHGLLDMRRAGARTFAQDEATSTVFGMPRAARQLGAADMLPLHEIAPAVADALGAAR